MKALYCLVLIALIFGCIGPAKADPVDFHIKVLDPPPPANSLPYLLYPISGTSFNVYFTPCSPTGELPPGMTADGCFAGHNLSGLDWTGLDLSFPAGGVLTGQPASCAPASSGNIFTTTDCPVNPANGSYDLGFSDGTIFSGDRGYFFITEDGVVPPGNFPTGEATASTAMTPEPASIVLLSSGVLLFGCLLYGERSRALRASLFS
ncbi:MAG TPA: hypothetical protein VMU57_05400 [Edaphobacter sp.]|uniref:hypothetical protein n=1 Tax=Edaphobacter sp. TaxID=1934404 RepID=UPI002BE3A6B3|nr:hypothetical protein [Edaphobacter sp.]HUZ94331.1 hypothetical protein [Edaphobacter sp.]